LRAVKSGIEHWDKKPEDSNAQNMDETRAGHLQVDNRTEDHSKKMEEVQENVRQAITELEQKLLSGEMQLNSLKCNEKLRQSAEQEVVSVKSQMPTKPAQEEVVRKEVGDSSPSVPRRGSGATRKNGEKAEKWPNQNRVRPRSPPDVLRAIAAEEENWKDAREWNEWKTPRIISLQKRPKHMQMSTDPGASRRIVGALESSNRPLFSQAEEQTTEASDRSISSE
jgi:hypothetical protein